MTKGLEAYEEIKRVMTRLFGNIERCTNSLNVIEKELKALEIIKKVFKSSSVYAYKLKDSLECGWITQEEYNLISEVLQCNTLKI